MELTLNNVNGRCGSAAWKSVGGKWNQVSALCICRNEQTAPLDKDGASEDHPSLCNPSRNDLLPRQSQEVTGCTTG